MEVVGTTLFYDDARRARIASVLKQHGIVPSDPFEIDNILAFAHFEFDYSGANSQTRRQLQITAKGISDNIITILTDIENKLRQVNENMRLPRLRVEISKLLGPITHDLYCLELNIRDTLRKSEAHESNLSEENRPGRRKAIGFDSYIKLLDTLTKCELSLYKIATLARDLNFILPCEARNTQVDTWYKRTKQYSGRNDRTFDANNALLWLNILAEDDPDVLIPMFDFEVTVTSGCY